MTEQKRSGRRAAPAPLAGAVAPDTVHGPYVPRRFASTMRYAAPATSVRWDAAQVVATEQSTDLADVVPLLADPAGNDQPSSSPADAGDSFDSSVIGLPVGVRAAAAGDRTPSRRRPVLAWSHRFAAVAAVSGLALAAAYPALDGGDQPPEPEERVAHQASASVADVDVPASDDFAIVRASVSSSFSKDDQLDYLMSASGGDASRINTRGVLAQPVDHVRITSPFGARTNPTGAGGQVHIGQDYGMACGSPVKASASGTVVQASWAGHSGNRVRVDHGNGLETTYNHNSSLKVSVGQKVKRGQVVSLSGTTGNSTGCHVHLEVLVDGTPVDPAGWL